MTQQAIKIRKLSLWRVAFAITLIIGVSALGIFSWRELRVDPAILANKPWYASYVDVTATPQFHFDQIGSLSRKDTVLSFIVADPADGCTPTWGGTYTLKEASDSLDVDRRIERLKQQGGSVAISFGGLKNDELATTCQSEDKLRKAYRTVIERYNLTTIDLDLENEALTDTIANTRRAKAIASLQQNYRAEGKPLAVWATIPVSSEGLTKEGTDAISALLRHSVDLAGINIMTMNYGENEVKGEDISSVAIASIKKTQRQIGVLYDQAGMHLNDATLWRKIGITPMVGQTDVKNQIFTLLDAERLNQFALNNGIGRVSMWSVNRDVECGANYVNIGTVSDSCSGIKQKKFAFSLALSAGFDGSIAGSADNVTVAEKKPSDADLADDPATSPYPIWSENSTHLQGAKVVWHRNVYQAKWWTKGDAPDNPVLQAHETPWELVGPVLPGEKPVKQLTVPAGTYPKWSGKAVYEAGKRVLFEDIPYQAKWWNQGESPAAASSSPDNSPWVPLTQAEIKKITK